MDTIASTRPPCVKFEEIRSSVEGLYGGKLEFVKNLDSERDINYLLRWKGSANDENGEVRSMNENENGEVSMKSLASTSTCTSTTPISISKDSSNGAGKGNGNVDDRKTGNLLVILKISNLEDRESVLKAQTTAMLQCIKSGCRVQKLFKERGCRNSCRNSSNIIKKEDLAGYISHICIPSTNSDVETYYCRLLEFEPGTIVSELWEEGKKSNTKENRITVWHEIGKSVGKVSNALRNYYADFESSKVIPYDLNVDFEWNLLSSYTVIQKYLQYFPEETAKQKEKKALVIEKFLANQEKYAKYVKQTMDTLQKGLVFKKDKASGSPQEYPGTTEDEIKERMVEQIRDYIFANPTLCHNDPNDNNLVVSNEGLVSVLDFGDLALSFPFADASIGKAYAGTGLEAERYVEGWIETSGFVEEVMNGIDKSRTNNSPFGSSRPVVSSVDIPDALDALDALIIDKVTPLVIQTLKEVIEDWCVMRRVCSVCISTFQSQNEPDNNYLSCSAKPIWKALGVEE